MIDKQNHRYGPNGEWFGNGYQVIKPIRGQSPNRAEAPVWASGKDWASTAAGAPASNRVRITYLRWHLGYTLRQIADETGLKEENIRLVIRRLRKINRSKRSRATAPVGVFSEGVDDVGEIMFNHFERTKRKKDSVQ